MKQELTRWLGYGNNPVNAGGVVGRGSVFARLDSPVVLPYSTEDTNFMDDLTVIHDEYGQFFKDIGEFRPSKKNVSEQYQFFSVDVNLSVEPANGSPPFTPDKPIFQIYIYSEAYCDEGISPPGG